jgi:hypothetical protein
MVLELSFGRILGVGTSHCGISSLSFIVLPVPLRLWWLLTYEFTAPLIYGILNFLGHFRIENWKWGFLSWSSFILIPFVGVVWILFVGVLHVNIKKKKKSPSCKGIFEARSYYSVLIYSRPTIVTHNRQF